MIAAVCSRYLVVCGSGLRGRHPLWPTVVAFVVVSGALVLGWWQWRRINNERYERLRRELMPRWVDVRVQTSDLNGVLDLLVKWYRPLDLKIDTSPPASGPEVQVSVKDRTEVEVRSMLEAHGISVLAIKTRIGRETLEES